MALGADILGYLTGRSPISDANSQQLTFGTTGPGPLLSQAQVNQTNATAKNTMEAYNKYAQPLINQEQQGTFSNDQSKAITDEIFNLLGLGTNTDQVTQYLKDNPWVQYAFNSDMGAAQQAMNKGGLAFSGNFANAAMDLTQKYYGQQLGYLQNAMNANNTALQTEAGSVTAQADLAGSLQYGAGQQNAIAIQQNARNLQPTAPARSGAYLNL